MFYMDIRHNVKKANSSKNAFHYLTRTGHFLAKKQDEELEFVRSGHLPAWAKNRPADFWKSADQHEIERGRTSTVLTVALPKGVVSGNGKYSTLRFFNCAQWPKFSTTYLGFASP